MDPINESNEPVDGEADREAAMARQEEELAGAAPGETLSDHTAGDAESAVDTEDSGAAQQLKETPPL